MKQLKGKKSASDYESTLNIIASCIDSIFDADNVYDAAEQSPKELMEFVESLSSTQFKHILELFKELPTLKHKEEITCKSCGTTTPVELEGLQSFF
jgi:hypothetical protein